MNAPSLTSPRRSCAFRHRALSMALTLLFAGYLAPAAAKATTTAAGQDEGAQRNLRQDPLRITELQRCGDLLRTDRYTFCLSVDGLSDAAFSLHLGDRKLPRGQVSAAGKPHTLRLAIEPGRWAGGPLHITQQGRASNAVWLSVQPSYVIAARPGEVARNDDGLTTYVDLVSVLIEEDAHGLQEARRIAEKYGAQVVGGIPPLNVYQLRLTAANLLERDAQVLRIGSEANVDAVIIEETAPETSAEGTATDTGAAVDAAVKEWSANRFHDAIDGYRRAVARDQRIAAAPVRIGIIERNVDFDTADFAGQLGNCGADGKRTCTFAKDAERPEGHGTTVAGILSAAAGNGGNTGLLSMVDPAAPGFDVIVDRNSDAGITANVAASVNLVQDGARILNWSWGLHRIGTLNVAGDEVDSLVRSGVAMSGYEELLEEFFRWLQAEHPDVVVVNSAGNGSAFSGQDDYRIPSAFITDQLIVVGGHERNAESALAIDHPRYAVKRASSNVDRRVDITAAACANASTASADAPGAIHCGTSYAAPLVTATLALMLSINPALTPEQLHMLLRRSAMPIGADPDFEGVDAEDLTAPILPSERAEQLDHPHVGYSARLNMLKAVELAIASRDRTR